MKSIGHERFTKRNGAEIEIKNIQEAISKLAKLEDMIESGQAVILQANIGDMVYGVSQSLSRVIYGELKWIDISKEGIIYTIEEFMLKKDPAPQYRLCYIYKNKHEAEDKIKELKNK